MERLGTTAWLSNVRSRGNGSRVRELVPFLALILLLLIFSQAAHFLSISNAENIVRQLPVLLMVAVGQTFVVLIGSIDLSVAGTINLAAAVSAVLVQQYGEIGLLAAPLVGMSAGVVNGLIVARARLPSFLVTLGSLFVLNGLALVITDGFPKSFTSSWVRYLTEDSILGSVSPIAIIALILWGFAVVYAIRTRFGRFLYAIGGGEEVARLSGIRVQRHKVVAFALSGLFAGFASLFLVMRASAATPNMGDPFLLTSVAAVVVGGTSLSGGIGGPHWTLLGALVIIVLDNGMTIAGLNPNFQTIIRGLVIIAAAALTIRRQSNVVK
jgi:ribose transport system permease protein